MNIVIHNNSNKFNPPYNSIITITTTISYITIPITMIHIVIYNNSNKFNPPYNNIITITLLINLLRETNPLLIYSERQILC